MTYNFDFDCCIHMYSSQQRVRRPGNIDFAKELVDLFALKSMCVVIPKMYFVASSKRGRRGLKVVLWHIGKMKPTYVEVSLVHCIPV